MMGTCLACLKHRELDQCHVMSKGAGGPNHEYNILLLCRSDHQAQHALGWSRFLKIYPHVQNKLIETGWNLETVHGRFVMSHPRLTIDRK